MGELCPEKEDIFEKDKYHTFPVPDWIHKDWIHKKEKSEMEYTVIIPEGSCCVSRLEPKGEYSCPFLVWTALEGGKYFCNLLAKPGRVAEPLITTAHGGDPIKCTQCPKNVGGTFSSTPKIDLSKGGDEPRMIIFVGGGLIQDILVDHDVKIIVCDEDISEEPDEGNTIINTGVGDRNVWVWEFANGKIGPEEIEYWIKQFEDGILAKFRFR